MMIKHELVVRYFNVIVDLSKLQLHSFDEFGFSVAGRPSSFTRGNV